jgi:outer membrane lipoprotein-sorting protein
LLPEAESLVFINKQVKLSPEDNWRLTVAATVLACSLCSCAVSHKTIVPPAQVLTARDATESDLLAQYNKFARSVQTVNAAVEMTPSAGSAYTGVIEQYHEVEGFILAMRPADIRVIGQAPVISKNIFDMASDGTTFEIFIPSKNKFVMGPANLQRVAAKPIENLRPQHLVEALLPPEIASGAAVLFEEWDEGNTRFYILTSLASAVDSSPAGSSAEPAHLEIARKIWFDRANLTLARLQSYGPSGKLDSDVHFAGWHDTGGGISYPADIHINRPHDGYQIGIHIKRLILNTPITADHFTVKQPPGAEVVRVGDNAETPGPKGPSQ